MEGSFCVGLVGLRTLANATNNQFHPLTALPVYVLTHYLSDGGRFQKSQVLASWFDSLISAAVQGQSPPNPSH